MVWRTTSQADRDIEEIGGWGALEFGLRRTTAYLLQLRNAFDLLATQPRMVRERLELKSRARLYPFRAHHVFYVIDGEDILILRVLSSHQDWLNLL